MPGYRSGEGDPDHTLALLWRVTGCQRRDLRVQPLDDLVQGAAQGAGRHSAEGRSRARMSRISQVALYVVAVAVMACALSCRIECVGWWSHEGVTHRVWVRSAIARPSGKRDERIVIEPLLGEPGAAIDPEVRRSVSIIDR
jgi:hypothetical protein